MKVLLFFSLFLLLFFACKKKEDTREVVSTTHLGGTTGTPQGTVATYNGLCSVKKTYFISGAISFSSSAEAHIAWFSTNTYNNFSSSATDLVSAGNISLNGATLKKDKDLFYTDTTYTPRSAPFLWNADGGNFAAFSYTHTTDFASYAGYPSWPDTIQKIYGCGITLTALQRADEVKVTIGNGTSPYVATYTALASAGSISVHPSGLTSLPSNVTVNLQCEFYKNNVQTINGSKINFRNATSFTKAVYLKN